MNLFKDISNNLAMRFCQRCKFPKPSQVGNAYKSDSTAFILNDSGGAVAFYACPEHSRRIGRRFLNQVFTYKS